MKNTPIRIIRAPIFKRSQRGVATLFTTIALLIGVTLISLNSSKMGVLELFMSNNYESRHAAFNQAESGLDALFSITRDIVNLNDEDGQTYCTALKSKFGGDCDELTISTANGWPTELQTKHQAQLIFEGTACAPRAMDTGCAHVLFAHYTMRSIYDDTGNNGGVAETATGAMELLPKFK